MIPILVLRPNWSAPRSATRCTRPQKCRQRLISGAGVGSLQFRMRRSGFGEGYVCRMTPSKDSVRKEIWQAMEREGVSRFPGAEGRIPNFAGAKMAAEKLAGHRLWKRAQAIKANPDSPQTHARRRRWRKARR